MALTNIPVTIGKGGLSKVIAKIGESSDLSTGLYFGYDNELGSGVVVAGGKVVSSKILDLSIVDSETSTGVKTKTINVTYLDPEKTDGTGKITKSFEVVSYDGVNSVINGVITTDFIGNAEGGAVTITPNTDENGNVSFKVGVNVDGTSVLVNGDGELAVDTYSLVEKDSESINADNVAEYVFTTVHADGTADTEVTIEIPKAKAIQTAGLVKYIPGSELSEEQKTALGEAYDESANYCVNLDTNSATKVETLPGNVTLGETYLHFVWGGDAGETNMAASELAVNYAGSDYINVENNTISLKYDELAAKLNSDYGIEKIAAIDASLNGVAEVLYTEETANEENSKHFTDVEGRRYGADGFMYPDVDGAYDEGYTPVSAGDVKVAGVAGITSRLEAVENMVSGAGSISTKFDAIDSSISVLKTAQADADASISRLEDAQAKVDSSVSALETARADADASISRLEDAQAKVDSSIASILDVIGEKEAITWQASELTEIEGVTYVTSTLGGSGTDEDPWTTEGATQANAGDVKVPAVKAVDERVSDLDASVAKNASDISTTNSSIGDIYGRLTWVDLDEQA